LHVSFPTDNDDLLTRFVDQNHRFHEYGRGM